ncbi:MAG: hypothetical protein E6G47_08940 [Actinobacteria bacterium]|nr:MAG: hypothetical protein E6G47_08940 [Actinomycetota bacterium]
MSRAAAAWESPNAVTPSQPSMPAGVRACRYPAAPASATAVHARVAAKGIDSATTELAIDRERVSPPTVAAGRLVPSLRKKTYRPNPATIGLSTIITSSARAHDIVEKSAITGA